MLSIVQAWKLRDTYELDPVPTPSGDSLHFVVQVWSRDSLRTVFQARILRRDSYDIRPAFGALVGTGMDSSTVGLVVPDDSHDWEADSYETEEAAIAEALRLLNEQLGFKPE